MGSPSVVRCSKPPRGVAGFLWNQWQLSPGIGGSFAMESVATFVWNQWQASRGIGGSFGVEYATLRRTTNGIPNEEPNNAC
jgi:hypothetical protein